MVGSIKVGKLAAVAPRLTLSHFHRVERVMYAGGGLRRVRGRGVTKRFRFVSVDGAVPVRAAGSCPCAAFVRSRIVRKLRGAASRRSFRRCRLFRELTIRLRSTFGSPVPVQRRLRAPAALDIKRCSSAGGTCARRPPTAILDLRYQSLQWLIPPSSVPYRAPATQHAASKSPQKYDRIAAKESCDGRACRDATA
ncbi:hypothetical protein EVAR_23034_1 [Eumeta japonica]|uniref:Uncharacterized protein n=1 Tax=Eumeta variegata TaxID=151549 RepID=A0A4C1UQF6_EUMVA|nr:hypothetical protein EVAR_23034_1 [Eumeta japonica]